MIAIKICGLRTIEHALYVAAAQANMIGLVFAKSRRQVTQDEAVAIVNALRQHKQYHHVKVVGLFVNEQPSQINAIADYCRLDYVQLSGDETPKQATGICRPIIKALRLNGMPVEDEWLRLMANQQQTVIHFAPCPLIIDSHVAGSYGGTGVVGDWSRTTILAKKQTLMLAGGLTPNNVTTAIALVRPWGVDVSSGVETNGIKDAALIEAFIQSVRLAKKVKEVVL